MGLNKGFQAGLYVISPSPTRIGMSRESSAHCLLPFSSQQPASRTLPFFLESSSDRICRTIQLGI